MRLIILSSHMRKILHKMINEKLYGEQNIIENMTNIKMVLKNRILAQTAKLKLL